MATACGSLISNKSFQANFQKRENISIRSLKFGAKSTKDETRMNSLMLYKKRNRFACMASAVEKSEMHFAKSSDFSVGKLVQNGLVYRQNVMIKSFEIGFDGKASITALMSHLQDSAINHVRITGTMADDHVLGITQEMCRKDLIWVLSSLQVVVDQYPSWLDVVEVETWKYESGKNGFGHDWIIRDTKTNHVVAEATSHFVLMNKKTRKLSKFTDKIRQELAPHMVDNCTPTFNNITQKPLKFDVITADFAGAELKPGWNDLDVNQHVNNVKYIKWILESVPRPLVERHKLYAMKLKYRKECNMDSVLHSLSKIITNNENEVELEHTLIQNGQQIIGARTLWKPRNDTCVNFNNCGIP